VLLPSLLLDACQRTPDATALIDAAGPCSYQTLDSMSTALAAVLAERGVHRGDRVVLALENSRWFVAAYLGTLRAGAVAVPLSPGQRSDRLPLAVQDCSPAACILDGPTLNAAWPLLPRQSLRVILTLGASEALLECAGAVSLPAALLGAGPFHPPRSIDLDLAAIIYTSGSTGVPRGVMLSHLNLVANTRSIIEYLHIDARQRAMLVLPLFYVYGLSVLQTHLAAGASIVLDNRFAFPNAVLSAMQEHEVTSFAGVPSTYAMLLDRSAIARTPLPALQYVTQAGGTMPPARIRQWLDVMPDVRLYLMYGTTEAGPRLAYLDPAELPRRIGAIGRAVPNVELTVMRDDGTVAEPGTVGELVARGSNIAAGYWGKPEETARAFTASGYRTGDLASTDRDGFITLAGRRSEFLKIGAHRVGPWEIEHALAEHPAIREAAVVGVPHEFLGEAAVACIALTDGMHLDEATLVRWCRGRLPEYKVPVRVLTRPSLPHTPSGKIDRPALAAVARQEVASSPAPSPAHAREPS
jgi:long-chain acyl-CoA synthetase